MPTEDVVIVPYRDGPYLVRGPMVLRDQDGHEIEVSRRTVALCRCGKSRMRPFCDGTHQLVQFRAPSQAESPWDRERPPAPKPRPASTGAGRSLDGEAPAPLVGLRRVRARLSALLDRPCGEPSRLAMRRALPLLDGAYCLLERSRPPAVDAELAALHLVMGAFDALGAAAYPPEETMAMAAAELAAVAVALEPRCNGSWPS